MTPEECIAELRRRMSACGAVVRDPESVRAEKGRARELWLKARHGMRVASVRDLPLGFKALDLSLTHAVYLEAIGEYLERGGKSRGSYLVPDAAGKPPHPLLGSRWAFSLSAPEDLAAGNILEVRLDGNGRVRKGWVSVQPVPRPEGWFETVWNDFREDRTVAEEE